MTPKTEQILVNVTPQECRVALIENGMLQELHIERADAKGIVGNIYKGKVVRVLPGMQAAFVEIGLERTAFLHAKDAHSMIINGEDTNEGDEKSEPAITSLVREGQEILVQVVKDPIGSKGARLTTELSIPSRVLVYLPKATNIGISQRITDESIRENLRSMIEATRDTHQSKGGYIARTTAETSSEKELQLDMKILARLWSKASQKAQKNKAPALVYEDLPLSQRVLRDFVTDSVAELLVDSKETHDKLCALAAEIIPDALPLIKHYPGGRPIFDLHSIEDEIERALGREVPLKSGGTLVIDQTEAMTIVDVNTAGFVGKRNLEETVFKTNLEAAQSIARQLRLRNIGGIIIVDFIDMLDKGHQQQVVKALERGLSKDSTKNNLTDVSTLGLVEITRKRTRESLERLLMEDCPVCSGRGALKTPQTVCNEILREILREARQYEASKFMVVASQAVVDRMLDEESSSLADLQEFIGSPVHLQVEPTYFQENYDVVLT
jgi:ribonuclease G